MSIEIKDGPIRWENSILGKVGQHTLGRLESLGKTILYTGLAVGQVAKIAIKSIISAGTGGGIERSNNMDCEGNASERVNPFSPTSLGKDCVLLAGLTSNVFKGLSGVIFAPASNSRSFIETAKKSGTIFLNAYYRQDPNGNYRHIDIYDNNNMTLRKFASITLPKVSLEGLKRAIFS